MCGITSCYNVENASEIILNMILTQEHRGKDATGIAFIENGEIKIHKKALSPEVYVKQFGDNIKKTVKSSIIIGHNRAASSNYKEKDQDKEAHPFIAEDGSFALVHNGTLGYRYEILDTFLDLIGHKRSSGVDTEIFVHILEELLQKYPREEAVKRFYTISDGNILILFSDGVLYGIPDGSFYLLRGDNCVYIASEPGTFKVLLDKNMKQDLKILKPKKEGTMVKLWKEGDQVKIHIWGEWEEIPFKIGDWVYNRTTSCDFCDKTGVPCESFTPEGSKKAYDRCLECCKKGVTKPRYNTTSVNTLYPSYKRRETLWGYQYQSPSSPIKEITETKKKEKKDNTGVAMCAVCKKPIPLNKVIYCTRCGRFFCEKHFKDHKCAEVKDTFYWSYVY